MAPCSVLQIYAFLYINTAVRWICRLRWFACQALCPHPVPGLFSPIAYIREWVLRSLESPLPLCIYRIAYFSQKNNWHDTRTSAFVFVLIYELCRFVLYVLTNRLLVWYNNSVVGNPTEQYRRTFLYKKYLIAFSSKNLAFSLPKGLLKQKQ